MGDVSSIQSIIENVVKNNPNHIAVKELDTGREITYLSLYEEAKIRSKNIDDTPYGIICLPDGIDCAIEFLAYAFAQKPFLARHPSRSIYETSLQDKFLKENFHPIPDGYQIRMSSGTTNKAKFHIAIQSKMVSYYIFLGKGLKMTPSDTFFSPMHMTNGIGDSSLIMTLIFGATLYCNNDNKKIEDYLSDIIQYKPSVIKSTPLILSAISEINNIKLSPRAWMTGGAPLNYEHALKIEDQISGVVLNWYGAREMALNQMCSVDDTQDKRLLTAGKVDMDKLKLGENGEIFISRDILHNFIPTKFDGDWYDTGDLGRIDEDGYLVITGRTKLMISLGGRDINPIEVESLCSGKSCLIGIGGVLCLCVEDDTDPRNHIRETLSIGIKYLWQGEIPELPSGKIDRIKMRDIIKQKINE
jgi:acyl-CoA synthetase (AMP-forming)/AMP-acid ligase II